MSNTFIDTRPCKHENTDYYPVTASEPEWPVPFLFTTVAAPVPETTEQSIVEGMSHAYYTHLGTPFFFSFGFDARFFEVSFSRD